MNTDKSHDSGVDSRARVDCEETLTGMGAEIRSADLSRAAIERTRSEVRDILVKQSERRGRQHPWPLWEKIAVPLSLAAGLMLIIKVSSRQVDVVEPTVGVDPIRAVVVEPEIARRSGRLVGDMNTFRRNYAAGAGVSIFERKKASLQMRMALRTSEIQRELEENGAK